MEGAEDLVNNEKIERIVEVARLYYESDLRQEDIANKLSISRPLVSKILADAKNMGIVTFRVNSPFKDTSDLAEEFCRKFGVRDCYIIENKDTDAKTNQQIIVAVAKRLEENLKLKCNVGIDWGEKISEIINKMTFRTGEVTSNGYACSMIGNSPTPTAAYHSNELLRKLCEKISYAPKFFYAPAFFETLAEMQNFTRLETCRSINTLWNILNIAIISIENHPSVPDFASATRFGTALSDNRAIGRFLGYYYNVRGEIIEGEADYTMHISIEQLRRVKTRLAITDTSTTNDAIVGAIRTGCISDIIIDKKTAMDIIEKY